MCIGSQRCRLGDRERLNEWCADVGPGNRAEVTSCTRLPTVTPMWWWLKKARLECRPPPAGMRGTRSLWLTQTSEGFRPGMHINDNITTTRCAWYSCQASPLQMQADRFGDFQPTTCFSPAPEPARQLSQGSLHALRFSSFARGPPDRLQYRRSRARRPENIVNRD